MAKRQADIIAFKPRTQVIDFPVKHCGCGCGELINKQEDAYISCEESGNWYVDEYDFLKGEKVAELNGRYYFTEDDWQHPHIYTKSELFQELGVYWVNLLVPIA